jgi:hypothetical protein
MPQRLLSQPEWRIHRHDRWMKFAQRPVHVPDRSVKPRDSSLASVGQGTHRTPVHSCSTPRREGPAGGRHRLPAFEVRDARPRDNRLPGRMIFARNPAVSAFPERVIGSACASSFSRLARRSLALRPAHSRCHQFVTRIPKASAISSPPQLLRLLPAGAVAGGDLHPLESAALSAIGRNDCP